MKSRLLFAMVAAALAAGSCTALPGGELQAIVLVPGKETVVSSPLRKGQKLEVRLRNESSTVYVYNPDYQACDMEYRNGSEGKFIIPPGTHCDLVSYLPIRPGETVTLFAWELDECVEDEWGCVRSEALGPGTYTVKGSLFPIDEHPPEGFPATFPDEDARPTPVSATFRIVV